MKLSTLKKQGIASASDKVPCWYCKHAIPKLNKKTDEYITGCNWSIYRQQVFGWKANKKEYGDTLFKERRKRNGINPIYTYEIEECPEFERGR